MKHYWPHDQAWAAPNNFMHASPSYINSGLVAGRKHYYQNLHHDSLAVSNFFAMYANGHKKEGAAPISPSAFQPFLKAHNKYTQAKISARAANTVMDLIRQRKMLQFVFEMLPLDEIKGSVDSNQGTGDCWFLMDKIAIFDPIPSGDFLHAPLALIRANVAGEIKLRQLGTGEEKMVVEVINEAESDTARIGAQFLIKEDLQNV